MKYVLESSNLYNNAINYIGVESELDHRTIRLMINSAMDVLEDHWFKGPSDSLKEQYAKGYVTQSEYWNIHFEESEALSIVRFDTGHIDVSDIKDKNSFDILTLDEFFKKVVSK